MRACVFSTAVLFVLSIYTLLSEVGKVSYDQTPLREVSSRVRSRLFTDRVSVEVRARWHTAAHRSASGSVALAPGVRKQLLLR